MTEIPDDCSPEVWRLAEVLSNATRDLDYLQWETPHGMVPLAAAALPHLRVQETPREHAVCNACGWDGHPGYDTCPSCGKDELNYFTPASAPHPRPVVDREAVIQALAGEVRGWPVDAGLPHHPDDARVVQTFARLADAVLALLPTEEGDGSTVCTCRTIAPSGWDTVQQVVDPRCPLHVGDATKALVEVGTKLGYELGRKEAGEEIADAIGMYCQEWSANTWRSIAAGIARELTSQPSGAVSTPLVAPTGHSDPSEDARPPQEPCEDPACPVPLMHSHPEREV